VPPPQPNNVYVFVIASRIFHVFEMGEGQDPSQIPFPQTSCESVYNLLRFAPLLKAFIIREKDAMIFSE
jgi:hypothetical protein